MNYLKLENYIKISLKLFELNQKFEELLSIKLFLRIEINLILELKIKKIECSAKSVSNFKLNSALLNIDS
jgi:hypothetical protein